MIRKIVMLSALILALGLSGAILLAQPRPPERYEVWVTNQVTDSIQIIDGPTLRKWAEIPLDDDREPATTKPHTIAFSPDGRYAYVANVGAKPGTNNVAVIHVADRKVVATLPAGPATHMVMPSPDGTRAFAANAGSNTITEIKADTEKGEFLIGRTITIPAAGGKGKSHPTCLIFSADSKRLYVTNAGPPEGDPARSGFLAILNVATGKELKRIPNLGKEACGQARSRDGRQIYFTIGGATGKYAILDTKTDRFIRQAATGGPDSHGLALTPGEFLVWVADRLSNRFFVMYATTLAPFKIYPDIGDKPDLLAFSPDGLRLFVTLRGKPATPVPNDAGGSEPGVAVIETATGKVLAKISLDGDPHGIAVRRQ